MAVVAGNGAKVHKIGLKEQATAGLAHIRQRVVADCGGSYRSATQGARGDCPQASRASYAARSRPNPSGGNGRQNAPSSTTPPNSAAPPDP